MRRHAHSMYIQPNAKYENIIPVFSAVSVCSDMHESHGGLEIEGTYNNCEHIENTYL